MASSASGLAIAWTWSVSPPWSGWLTAVRRLGRDVPLVQTQSNWSSDDWYQIAAGKGVLLLERLRGEIGEESSNRPWTNSDVAMPAAKSPPTNSARQSNERWKSLSDVSVPG